MATQKAQPSSTQFGLVAAAITPCLVRRTTMAKAPAVPRTIASTSSRRRTTKSASARSSRGASPRTGLRGYPLSSSGLECRLEPGRNGRELLPVPRLDHDLDLRSLCVKAGIGADEHAGMALDDLLEDGDDPALRRPVAAAPARDWRSSAQLVADRLEHRPHLRGETRQDVHVGRDETRRAAQRVLERPAACRQPRPARRVFGVAAEARA